VLLDATFGALAGAGAVAAASALEPAAWQEAPMRQIMRRDTPL
jgi:hypothetical protein